MAGLRIGIVDTGVNAWHSHVRGKVSGCRIYLAADGTVHEDGDFRDPVGHGTAVAGVIREAFPDAEICAVRVFDGGDTTYPSLVARGIAYRQELWSIMERNAGAPWFLGNTFSTIDVFIAIMTRWSPKRGWFDKNTPKLRAIAEAVDRIPALAHVWARNFGPDKQYQ